MNDFQLGNQLGKLREHVRGMVLAAIIDYEDLEILGESAGGHTGRYHHAGDGTGVVVRGKQDRYAGYEQLGSSWRYY